MATIPVTINPRGKPTPNPAHAKGTDSSGGPDQVTFTVNGTNSFVFCFPPPLFGGNNKRLVVCGGATSQPLTVKVPKRTEPYQYSIKKCGNTGDCADCPNTNPNCTDPAPEDTVETDPPPQMIID